MMYNAWTNLTGLTRPEPEPVKPSVLDGYIPFQLDKETRILAGGYEELEHGGFRVESLIFEDTTLPLSDIRILVA